MILNPELNLRRLAWEYLRSPYDQVVDILESVYQRGRDDMKKELMMEELKKFDWHHRYSEDKNVYDAAKKHETVLTKQLEQFNNDDIYYMLLNTMPTTSLFYVKGFRYQKHDAGDFERAPL